MTPAPAMRPLADLCEAVTVGHVGKTSEYYCTDGVPFLRTQNVGKGELILDDLKFITQEFHDSLKKSQLKSGDVLVTRVVTDEMKCGIVPASLGRANCANVILIRPKPELNPKFLSYLITSPVAQSYLLERRVGSAQQVVNTKVLKDWPVPKLPIEEQQQIVSVLDQAFAALDRARAHAEANLADAQELFDNTLLATFDELLSTAAMMTLSDASDDFSRGKSRHRPRNDPKLYDGDYPFIQTGDIRRSEGSIREYTQTYNDAGLEQSKLWPVGTVCITIAANIAETGVLEFEGCFPDSVIGMVPNPNLANAYYVEYMLRYFAKELKLQGKGSAQDNINLATFENARFPFPSLEQQVRVVDRLDAVAADVGNLRTRYQQKLADLATLRQSLLQKAFSGELT